MSAPRDRSAGAQLEIRILDGVHAGAVVAIESGQTVSVGSLPANDVVLVDAPFDSAQLAATDEGWEWAESDPGIGEHSLALGRGLKAGALSLMVSDASAPWAAASSVRIDYERPTAQSQAGARVQGDRASAVGGEAGGLASDSSPGSAQADDAQRSSDAEAGSGGGDSTGSEDDASASTRSGAQALDAPVNAPGAESRANEGRRAAKWLGPGAVLVALAWFGGQALMREAVDPPPVARADPTPSAVAGQDDLDRINALIVAAGFSDVVKVRLRDDGRIEVIGVLDSVDEQDQVMRLLSVERRLIALRLLSQAEFVERVREAARGLPGGFDATAVPGGRVMLSGMALTEVESRSASDLLSSALPEMMGLTLNVRQPADVAGQLAAQLLEKGLSDLTVNWNGTQIVISGQAPRSSQSSIESMLLAFNAGPGERLSSRASFALLDSQVPAQASPDRPVSALPPPKLPRIVAVQSGGNSYLLFADGSRVLPGGIVNGYRLASIEDEALVFEDRDGNLHRVPR